MNSGVTNTPLQLLPKPYVHLPSTRRGRGTGGCSSCVSLRLLAPRKRWVRLCASSSTSPCSASSRCFRTRAAVEDGLLGSMPQEDNRSFYELLGISEDGSFSEIKWAYKQLARKYHPDVSPPDRREEYTHRFIEVQEAYETLSDPGRRALYDRDLARGLHLAFAARRRSEDGLMEKPEWRNRWQNQVTELKKRSMKKDSGGNMSWGARMRRQRDESSAE